MQKSDHPSATQALISVYKLLIKFVNKLDLSASFFGLCSFGVWEAVCIYTAFSRYSDEIQFCYE